MSQTCHNRTSGGRSDRRSGADAEAACWLRRSIEANRNAPAAHFWLAAALGLLGVLDEARAAAKAGLALNPDFTIRRSRAVKSSDHPTVLAGFQRLLKGLGQSILSAIERQE
jgi:hypothetical protein